jgi:hypothetical protein
MGRSGRIPSVPFFRSFAESGAEWVKSVSEKAFGWDALDLSKARQTRT